MDVLRDPREDYLLDRGYDEIGLRLALQRIDARLRMDGLADRLGAALRLIDYGGQSAFIIMHTAFESDWAEAWWLHRAGMLDMKPEGEPMPRASMTPKEFQRFLDRDGGRCVHCGTTEGLVPQHRAGRGMGGSRALNKASNVIVLCSSLNGLIESDAVTAAWAHTQGWHLKRWQDPATTPCRYNTEGGGMFLLADDFSRTAC